jgi:nitroreductase
MPEPVELTAFLRSLRAVRRFSSVAVPDMVLHDILEVARWTGSAKNSQPWHLIVIRERATLETLAKCGPFAGHLARAKLAIALVMETGNQRFDEGQLAHNLMLAAWAHNVGSCIGSIYPEANTGRAKQLLSVPDTRWLHTAISFGYPADPRALRLSAERGSLTEVPIGRRHLASLVSWERYGAGPTLN